MRKPGPCPGVMTPADCPNGNPETPQGGRCQHCKRERNRIVNLKAYKDSRKPVRFTGEIRRQAPAGGFLGAVRVAEMMIRVAV